MGSFHDKARTIGVQNTVDFLLPCLVSAYNSDQAVHWDIYENHVHLLFNNLGDLISFLALKKKKQRRKSASSFDELASSNSSDTEDSDAEEIDPRRGLSAISGVLVPQIYTSFF